MCNIKPIRTEGEYQAALARVYTLMHSEPGTLEGEEFDLLADLVDLYEYRYEPIPDPDTASMIEFWLDQKGWTVPGFNALLGGQGDIGAVIAGKQELTMPMAQLLYEQVGVPAADLLKSTVSHPKMRQPLV